LASVALASLRLAARVEPRRAMRADHRRLPFTIGTDKHASYPEAFAASIKEKVLPSDCKLCRVKYLNNVIEQDHRAIRRRWRAMQCFRSFHTAESGAVASCQACGS
jgi:transposase-like protein